VAMRGKPLHEQLLRDAGLDGESRRAGEERPHLSRGRAWLGAVGRHFLPQAGVHYRTRAGAIAGLAIVIAELAAIRFAPLVAEVSVGLLLGGAVLVILSDRFGWRLGREDAE
jgi:hypothetical protein